MPKRRSSSKNFIQPVYQIPSAVTEMFSPLVNYRPDAVTDLVEAAATNDKMQTAVSNTITWLADNTV